jgi:hypothetical protein
VVFDNVLPPHAGPICGKVDQTPRGGSSSQVQDGKVNMMIVGYDFSIYFKMGNYLIIIILMANHLVGRMNYHSSTCYDFVSLGKVRCISSVFCVSISMP